jgi:hypothetical protein
MLSVVFKSIMLSVIVPIVIMLGQNDECHYECQVIILTVIVLSVIMLCVIMVSV